MQRSAVWVWVAYVRVYVDSSAVRERIQRPWTASGTYACARVRLCMLACMSRLPIFDTLARTGRFKPACPKHTRIRRPWKNMGKPTPAQVFQRMSVMDVLAELASRSLPFDGHNGPIASVCLTPSSPTWPSCCQLPRRTRSRTPRLPAPSPAPSPASSPRTRARPSPAPSSVFRPGPFHTRFIPVSYPVSYPRPSYPRLGLRSFGSSQ
jgi:hypothetical protein